MGFSYIAQQSWFSHTYPAHGKIQELMKLLRLELDWRGWCKSTWLELRANEECFINILQDFKNLREAFMITILTLAGRNRPES